VLLKVVDSWEAMLSSKMELFSAPPSNYCNIDTNMLTTPEQRLQALINPSNTPFTCVLTYSLAVLLYAQYCAVTAIARLQSFAFYRKLIEV
jgi:hypothetical protein